MKSNTPAILFCGGYSQRMGSPKHLLMINGIHLWQHQLKRLKTVFNEVCISCREEQKEDFAGQNMIIDQIKDIGPMAGIIASLDYHHGIDIFILSVDALGVNPETMLQIVNSDREKILATAAISMDSKRLQPLIAKWNHASKDPMLKFAQAGQHSPTRFLEQNLIDTITVSQEELVNVNTPEDFEHYYHRTHSYVRN